MSKATILISGLPGKMATLVAEELLKGEKFNVCDSALTGSNQPERVSILGHSFYLKAPEAHEPLLKEYTQAPPIPIVVDFSQPDATNRNAELFCKYNVPFVMGTTGGDRKRLEQVVVDTQNLALISPNMAYPVVLMQAMLEKAAQEFPGLLEGFSLKVEESHQAAKKDTSGTAKAIIAYFNKLGIPFNPEQIKMHRDPVDQIDLGVPPEHLDGHGWHTYTVTSADRNVMLEFKHNINGRQPYLQGTMKALDFLIEKLKTGERGKVYSMIDVMRGL